MLHEKFQFMGKITSDSSLSQLHPSLFMDSTQRALLHLYGDSNHAFPQNPHQGWLASEKNGREKVKAANTPGLPVWKSGANTMGIEHKHNTEALQEQEARARLVVENAGNLIATLDLEGHLAQGYLLESPYYGNFF